MSRVQRIIEWATREARSKPECALSEKVYRDEPILITASQMRQFLPREYREMRAIATSSEARFKPSAWVFAQQAKLMENFEDEFPYNGEFVRYYPTYMAMSEDQLRGYFTWRAHLRRGEMPQGPTSFAFVYIYELLNGAGWKTPEEGFTLLKEFYEHYGEHDSTIRRYLKRWMVDFAVWYGVAPDDLDDLVQGGREEAIKVFDGAAALDASQMGFERDPHGVPVSAQARLEEGSSGIVPDAEPAVSGDCAHSADDETSWDALFDAIVALSTYRVEASRLFKEYPNEFRRALCGTCVALARYCEAHRKTSFSEGLFGAFREEDYVMFQNAVFYNDGRHIEAAYCLPDGRMLTCKNGRWRQKKRVAVNRGPKLGAIAKTVDACVREELAMSVSLKAPELPKYMARIVADEAHAAVAWEQAHKPFELDLDVSKLSGIRSAASETCEALLVDEERDAGAESSATFDVAISGLGAYALEHSSGYGFERSGDGSAALLDGHCAGAVREAESASSKEGVGCCSSESPDCSESCGFAAEEGEFGDCPLNELERRWVVALLDGDVGAAYGVIVESALTEDLMADAVNEKLFDYLGDTAVGSCGSGYAVVEDYREDVEGLVR